MNRGNENLTIDKPFDLSGDYEIRIFLKGLPGFIRYKVHTKEQVMDHFATIVSNGYRRVNDRGQFEWFSPSKLDYIRIIGPGLDSNYPDEMVRT